MKLLCKKQHVFEAICRLLLLYNYDNGELGHNKAFYTSLEDIISGKNDIMTRSSILKTDINVGAKAGLADIIFKTNVINVDDSNNKKWACETTYDEKKEYKQKSAEDTYIMIQNSSLGDKSTMMIYITMHILRCLE